MGVSASSGEARPCKWKVQLWESAGNAWSQQQALAGAAGEAAAAPLGSALWDSPVSPAGKPRHQSSHLCRLP